jgi:hypothetical protein
LRVLYGWCGSWHKSVLQRTRRVGNNCGASLADTDDVRQNAGVKTWVRFWTVVGGLYFAGYGLHLTHQHVLAYQTLTYRLTAFSPAVIVTGLLIAALGLLPKRLMARIFRSARPHKPELYPHHHRQKAESSNQP